MHPDIYSFFITSIIYSQYMSLSQSQGHKKANQFWYKTIIKENIITCYLIYLCL